MKQPGQSLMVREFDCQVAELQIRAAVLNGYTVPGIPVTEPWDKWDWGKEKSKLYAICATKPGR